MCHYSKRGLILELDLSLLVEHHTRWAQRACENDVDFEVSGCCWAMLPDLSGVSGRSWRADQSMGWVVNPVPIDLNAFLRSSRTTACGRRSTLRILNGI